MSRTTTRHAAADSATRSGADDHLALRLWLRLLATSRRIEGPLRRWLRAEFASSLARFDLMAQLERHPQGLRMRELSRLLMVTGGNVTGLTDRLVAEGLVERRDDARDRRACTVQLTAEGQQQFRAMAKAHEGWIIGLLAGLTTTQQERLLELLRQLERALPDEP